MMEKGCRKFTKPKFSKHHLLKKKKGGLGGGARVPAQAIIQFIQDTVRLYFFRISYQIPPSPAEVVSRSASDN